MLEKKEQEAITLYKALQTLQPVLNPFWGLNPDSLDFFNLDWTTRELEELSNLPNIPEYIKQITKMLARYYKGALLEYEKDLWKLRTDANNRGLFGE